MTGLDRYPELWAVDFEFLAGAGERPVPVCVVAHELRTRRTVRRWLYDTHTDCPYPLGSDALFIAFYASAELGCHRVLGWADPVHVLDLFVEYALVRNGLAGGRSLLDAALGLGIPDAMSATDKDRSRALVLRGGPWSSTEQAAILDYCAADVRLTADVFRAMCPYLQVEYALLRGQFMAACADMEYRGVPIDRPMLDTLRTEWEALKYQLVSRIDRSYGVYEDGHFRRDRFAAWLTRHNIPWSRLETGQLDLSDETFRQAAKMYPAVAPLRELRHALSQLRLSELAVGADNRNRCLLSPFRAKTGRCAPSNSKFIFGPSVWLRHLIRPTPGTALAHVDYSQQEFGIAAALSGDANMQAAYRTGDPYLAFAQQAGAVPADATKATHGPIRERHKIAALAVQYGMRGRTLAAKLGQPEWVANELLRQHRDAYAAFWRWSDAAVDYAMLHRHLFTVYGWRVRVGPTMTDRSLRNYPMQANGSEMLRLACIFAIRCGVTVLAPIHDAVLIEAPVGEIDDAVRTMQRAMRDASVAVLAGFSLGTDAKVIRAPDRYSDPRGVKMWQTVQACLAARHVEVASVSA